MGYGVRGRRGKELGGEVHGGDMTQGLDGWDGLAYVDGEGREGGIMGC